MAGKERIVIIGAGPTGLAAARRLKELGHDNFAVYEKNGYAGGLAASFCGDQGFTWDIGGHVFFSHYRYFDRLLDEVLAGDVVMHERSAWIRMMDRWIPYPFQSNIRRLPERARRECVRALAGAGRARAASGNFREWILGNFGRGIAKYFMFPYNRKAWAYPLELLGAYWIGERVCRDADTNRTTWGPNATFGYPRYGGTGEVFRKIARSLGGKIRFNAKVERVEPRSRRVFLEGGGKDSYDLLVNTSPLDLFVRALGRYGRRLSRAASHLEHNGVFVVGIGLRKRYDGDRCWVYFPQGRSPFYRMTYLSRYSPNNVPEKGCSSLLCETAYSRYRKEGRPAIIGKTVRGLIDSGILRKSDRARIVSTFCFDAGYAYPIPTLTRDRALGVIQPALERAGIYSRGRFGAWRYETGNMDHSCMQGKEIIDRMVRKTREKVWRA